MSNVVLIAYAMVEIVEIIEGIQQVKQGGDGLYSSLIMKTRIVLPVCGQGHQVTDFFDYWR